MKNVDILVVGGGSAALSAAVSAFDNGVHDILILERGDFLGGILNQCIHNGFGLTEFKEELTGPEFAERFIIEAKKRDIPYRLHATVTNISQDKVVTYVDEKEGVVEVKAKAIIMATGSYERSAGAIALPGDRPSGILTAGQAQLFLNEFGYLVGKDIFILGSGDIGLIMARRLTLEGAKVHGVAEICPFSNGLNRNLVQCLYDYNIPLYLSHTVSKVVGKSRLEKVIISEVDDDKRIIPGTDKEFDVDTLILSVGLIPNNDLLNKMGAKQGRSRGAAVNENFETSIPGVYSCGNVLHVHDLVDNVVAEARVAGLHAARYVEGLDKELAPSLKVTAGDGIGYVVPSCLSFDESASDLTFKFRVRLPSKNVYIVYSLNGTVIKKVFKSVIIPSEMEIEKLPLALFAEKKGELVVSLVPKENL